MSGSFRDIGILSNYNLVLLGGGSNKCKASLLEVIRAVNIYSLARLRACTLRKRVYRDITTPGHFENIFFSSTQARNFDE